VAAAITVYDCRPPELAGRLTRNGLGLLYAADVVLGLRVWQKARCPDGGRQCTAGGGGRQHANPALFAHSAETEWDKWFDLGVWAGLLTIMAYAMGTLYERKEVHLRELRRTYFGVLSILRSLSPMISTPTTTPTV